MNKTARPIHFRKLSLASVFLIFIFLSGCKTGPGDGDFVSGFGSDRPKVILDVVHPPPTISPTRGYEYLQIHDFEGSPECARPLNIKIRELAGKGFKLGPFFPKEKTVELRGHITTCNIEKSFGEIEAEFSFSQRGVQRERKTISKRVTLSGGSTRSQIIRGVVSKVGDRFARKFLPRKVRSLRWLCGSNSDHGVIAGKKGSWETAYSHFYVMLKRNPKSSCSQMNLGVASEATGRLDEAHQNYQYAMVEGNDDASKNDSELCLYHKCQRVQIPGEGGGGTGPTAWCPIQEKDPSPKPAWVNKPDAPGYSHVATGVASNKDTIEALEQSSIANARAQLSAAIQVTVTSDFRENIKHRSMNGQGGESLSETTTSIDMVTKEHTKNLLVNAKQLDQWKNKNECAAYTLMGITKESLTQSRAAYQKQWEQSLLSKPIMLFDLSTTPSDMAELLQGKLRGLFSALGVQVLQKDMNLKGCVTNPKQSQCEGTMFGGFSAELLDEAEAQGSRKREFLVKGDVVFGERLVSQINKTCLGQGSVGDSNRVIDKNGIDECFLPDIVPPLLRAIQK